MTMMRLRRIRNVAPMLGVCVVVLGCAKGQAATPSPSYEREVITAEEIATAQQTTALELVRYLRPQWLRSRGQDSFRSNPQVVVYVNNTRTQGIDHLNRVRPGEIREIRFLDGITASQRFGLGHGSGAILVTLR